MIPDIPIADLRHAQAEYQAVDAELPAQLYSGDGTGTVLDSNKPDITLH